MEKKLPRTMARPDIWVSQLLFAGLSFLIAALIGIVHYFAGYHVQVSYFYFFPIFISAWYSWRAATLSMAIAIGFFDELLNVMTLHQPSIVDMWNTAIKIVFCITSAYLLMALKGALDRADGLSREDPLTKLANSRHFYEVGNIEVSRAARYGRPLTVAFMDIDDFKAINDRQGHKVADMVLCQIADKIRNTIRLTDMIARLGGDEFAILFPETNPDAAKGIIKRIQDTVREVRVPGTGPITFSFGVITSGKGACALDDIIKAADTLMYSAKRSGKNTVVAEALT